MNSRLATPPVFTRNSGLDPGLPTTSRAKLPGHRVRAPNPQIETNRLDRMLRECPALNFLNSHINRRREQARNRNPPPQGLLRRGPWGRGELAMVDWLGV
jgi:hypothetical protein